MSEIRYGVVSAVYHDKGMVKVEFPDLEISSATLIVLQGRNKGIKQYSMPKISEVGLCLLTATGNSGYYIGSGYNESEPVMSEAGEGKYITIYPDGSKVIFDETISKLYIHSKNNIEIESPQITIKGDITVEGGITTTKDVTASGISLVKHKTTGIKAGSDISGTPV